MHREIKLVNVFLLLVVMYASAEELAYGCSQLQSLEHLLEKLVRIEFKLEQLEKKHSDASESTGRESSSCAPLQRLDDLSDKIEQLEKGQTHSDVKVAFTAVMSDNAINLQAGQIVIFNKLDTNIGDGYKPSSGQFIAPMNGTYHFHTSFLSGHGVEVWTEIDLNGAGQVWANARGTDGRHGTGSQSVILELKTGDMVCVKIHNGNTILGGGFSSFSGFLMN